MQHERVAGETRATSQREAIEARRQARLASSRALAVSAASGAGAGDPDVINRIAELEGEGEYNALRAMYEGDTSSDTSLERAAVARKAGKTALITSVLSGAGDIGTATLAQKYG